MNILILTNEYPPHTYGGAGVHVEYLARELARRESVEVRCFGDQDETRESLRVRGDGFDEVLRPADARLESPFHAFSRNLRAVSAAGPADVVHGHTWYTHFGGLAAARSRGIPLVVTTHSLEPLRPWKREQLGGGYDVSCWIERCALESADAVIAVSRGMKKDILRLFDVEADRVRVIYNGIDTGEYRRTERTDALTAHGVDPARPYVLFVGRVTRQKGIVHLVRAARHLDEKLPLVLCAGAPDTPEIGAEMEQAVEQLRADSGRSVFWIREMLSREQLIQFYSHAAVFCCPSIYEPFGIINLEAMACGTPVVASAVGGIREVVEHGHTGMLVPLDRSGESPYEPRDPEQFARDLAEAVQAVADDPESARKMGEAGRRRAESVFSWSAIADQVIDLYRELIDG